MELTYTNQGDYRLPNLIAPEEPEVHLGKYALLRRSYLKNHRRILFTNLLTSGKLNAHLMEIEEAAQNRMEQIVKAMVAQEGVTEELKASDQMEWVRRMNAIRDSAEEVIRKADKQRASYYNYYATATWGAVENYDLCVDTGAVGVDGAVETIIHFVELQEKFRREKK